MRCARPSVARESGSPLAIGAALEAQGQLAREGGEVSGAEELLHEALRAFFPVRQPGYEAELSALREALSDEAFAAAWSAGASASLDDAVAYAERGRGERKRPLRGWESLSPAELRVVQLVAEGLTNPQIVSLVPSRLTCPMCSPSSLSHRAPRAAVAAPVYAIESLCQIKCLVDIRVDRLRKT